MSMFDYKCNSFIFCGRVSVPVVNAVLQMLVVTLRRIGPTFPLLQPLGNVVYLVFPSDAEHNLTFTTCSFVFMYLDAELI